MDIKKLKEEIHKESYRSDPRSLIDVIDVDTLIDIIDELQAKNNEVLDLVSEPLQARRHITEKELMIASKQLKWRGSEIEYLIKKVRDNQTKSNAR